MKPLKWLKLAVVALIGLFSSAAFAATSVQWTSPADGSIYATGTDITAVGVASASGISGTGTDLALVIDVSGSMGGSGITAAKAAATALVNSLDENSTAVTVVAFNSSANTVQQLTALNADKAAVLAAIDGLSTGGGTNIGNGIIAATAELNSVRHTAGWSQQMIVLSDGYSSSGYIAAAEAAADEGMTVNTVGIPGHNSSQMSAIANSGNGVYTNVTDLDDITDTFTSGALVGIDYVEVTMPDGTTQVVPVNGVGQFSVDWTVEEGVNEFLATAYGTDDTSATAGLTVYGTSSDVPEPATLSLLGLGLLGLGVARRRK